MSVGISKSCLALAAAALLGSVAAVRADNFDRQMTLTNQSHQTITEFHASNEAAGTWEENILGRSVVLPGQSVRLNLNDHSGYCNFDFKTITDAGSVIIQPGVNVCTTNSYTLVD